MGIKVKGKYQDGTKGVKNKATGLKGFLESEGVKSNAKQSISKQREEVLPKLWSKKTDTEMSRDYNRMKNIKNNYDITYPFGDTDSYVDAIMDEPIYNKEMNKRGLGSYSEGTKGVKTKSDKQKKEDRLAQFSPTTNARVAQLQTRSENGFKGERLNDHGLPLGDNLGKEVPIIQKSVAREDGAKFRKQTYQDGSKGIKIKPKTSMPADNTRVSLPKRALGKPEFTDYSTTLSTLSDDEIGKDIRKNALNFKGDGQARYQEAQDTLNTRNNKKSMKYASNYKEGTKSIKTKKMC